MKLGVLLPTFRNGSDDALAFAGEAARQGIDGVFAYDHLWPMGSPERPALSPFPVLAAIAKKHQEIIVAPLVARVGLVGTSHLVEEFRTLNALAPGRVIAALGTGDRLSADENEAYGLVSLSGAERRELLIDTATQLFDEMPVWFGEAAMRPINSQLTSEQKLISGMYNHTKLSNYLSLRQSIGQEIRQKIPMDFLTDLPQRALPGRSLDHQFKFMNSKSGARAIQ